METAAERELLMEACRDQTVKSILQNSLDVPLLSTDAPAPAPSSQDYMRGSEYFN
jgi:hypothetical protein